METKKIKDYLIEVVNDEYPENPRSWDNLGTMVCFHKRYDLGDKHDYNHNDYDSWEELEKAINENEKVHTILPLYLYDHSGITISTKPFGCPWDSGQIGFIFISKDKVKEEGLENDKIESYLINEVDTYDKYICGQMYGYRIFKVNTCNLGCEHKELMDSCWGYYDEDECMKDAEDMVSSY
jgi:hypothetical protein